MRKTVLALAACAVAFAAAAKLPPPDPAAKAKADEAAAKAAWQAKVDSYDLCKVQDRIAAKYGKHEGKAGAKAAPAPAKPGAASAATGSGSTPTPAVASAPPACADPGPFAYNKPEEKPLETSEAHSPAGNATSPPSTRQEAAKVQPSGKTGTKK